MRLTLFLLLIFTLTASAKSFSQKVNFSAKSVRLEKALNEIRQQTGYAFVWDQQVISKLPPIDVSLKGADLTEALKTIFDGLPLTYRVQGKVIYVGSRSPVSVDPQKGAPIILQPRQVHGRVTDSAGNPISGVSIVIKNTRRGTVTDNQGTYKLSASEGDILQISYVGYISKEITIGQSAVINVQLQAKANSLSDMVVVGYGVQKKENLTEAVTQVSGKVLQNRPIKSVAEGLKGLVAGLNITAPSGAPEASLNLNIRGFTGMSQTAAPLILVDGVERNINDINPNDVASISVLKDGASSAIYGSRAPFGVILITTKSGKKGERMQVSYSGNLSYGIPYGVPTTSPSFIQSAWINYELENRPGGSGQPFYSDNQIAQMKAWYNNRFDTTNPVFDGIPDKYIPYGVYPLSPTAWGGHQQVFASTDWVDLMLKKVIPQQKHSVSITGGNNSTQYYIGLGYNQNNGIFNESPNYKNDYTILSKINTQVNQWLSLGLSTNYVHTDRQSPSNNPVASPSISISSTSAFSSDYGGLFGNLARAYTMWPQFNPDGSYYQFNNAIQVSGANGVLSVNKNDITVTGKIIVTPVKDLQIESDLTYRNTTQNGTATFFTVYQTLPNGSSIPTLRTNSQNGIAKYADNNKYYTVDIHASYAKSFNGHHFSAIAGFQSEQNSYNYLNGSGTNLFSQSIPALSTASANFKTFDQINDWATEGFFGRLTYDYNGKYIFEFNMRHDANSRFLAANRWASFPSLAFAWNIARENFWTNKDLISVLKPRVSWSNSGNANVGSLYPFYPSINANLSTNIILGGALAQTASAPALVNPSLTWSKPRSYDVGIDIEALKRRLEINYDWYQRTVRDQFGPANPLPTTIGASLPQANNSVSETRGWELNAKWHDKAFDVLDKTLTYNIGIRLSDYIGYVVQYNGNNTGSTDVWVPGQKFGENYVYRTNGVAQNLNDLYNNIPQGGGWYYPGDLMRVDVNGDGQISSGQGTWYSMGDLVKDGFNYPRYRYGISLSLEWNNFNISTELEGIGKWKVYSGNMYVWGAAASQWFSPFFKENLDLGYWTLHTPDAFYPRIDVNGKNQFASDRYILNLANLRIRNVRMGYNLPQSLTKKLGLSRFYVYSSMENLGFIFYKSWIKFDPELLAGASGQGYPPQRYVSFGVNVDF